MKRYVYEGEVRPFGYGFAYMSYERMAMVMYPFPLNWIIRYGRAIWWKICDPEIKWFEREYMRLFSTLNQVKIKQEEIEEKQSADFAASRCRNCKDFAEWCNCDKPDIYFGREESNP